MIYVHKPVDVEVGSPSLSSSATVASSSPLADHSLRNSRPASPHFGHHPPPHQQEQQEEEDLVFEGSESASDVVKCINLSIPRSSAYPFLYSASDVTSPTTTTPPRSSASTSTSEPTTGPTNPSLSSHPTVTPSHYLEPIFISHRIKWIVFIHNKDGHVSELRCSLPIRILDGALLEEGRGLRWGRRRG